MANGKKRRIIYTDATKDGENSFKIGLFDPDINRTQTLQLKEGISSINEAEKFGILYALLYINENQLANAIILSDNQNSATNKILKALACDLKCQISWIPREINIVADKIAKLEPTLKDDVWYNLKLFHDLIFKKS